MPAAFVLAPVVAALAAAVFGYFCVRLSSIYFAMLTLAFAQIVYAVVHQWDDVTGGGNGMLSGLPAPRLRTPSRYYYLAVPPPPLGLLLLRPGPPPPLPPPPRAAPRHPR